MGNSQMKRKTKPAKEAPPPPIPSDLPVLTMNALQYKEKGNQYFAEKKFDQASQCYSKSILLDPGNPAYFTNRAIAEIQMHQYEEAADDCKKAIELDPINVKGFFYLAKACYSMKKINQAVEEMQKAVKFSQTQEKWKEQKNKLEQTLQDWQRELFVAREEEVIQKETDLNIFLAQLIIDHRDQKINEARSFDYNSEVSVSKITNESQARLEMVNKLFEKQEEARLNRDIPDYLCCKISLDILKNPVITPSGITYDRGNIEEHLTKVGPFDPSTMKPLTIPQLIPNLAMKEAVDAFIAENEWAQYSK